jgi:hypothetical protein
MRSKKHPSDSTPPSAENTLLPDGKDIIRTETVLSKLPVHNLSKTGSINIQISQKNPQGKVELFWEVSHSSRHGEPRALAYKLETLIINRRIEEAGRPIPKIIRLGTLREIARELGMGHDTPAVKKALHQNAGAYITAKLSYKGLDGSEQTLEAAFTRYAVVFRNQRFSNGETADVVHIELHDRYLEVLNKAPFRPLDYTYLKALPPGAQRFYEILSRKMFIALKYKHPYAKLAYSEYCTCSAQQRYYEREAAQKQMYKIHLEHKKSQYILNVRYVPTTDENGKPDWLMYYTPGPKAMAEYNNFTSKGGTINITPAEEKAEKLSAPPPPPAPTVDEQLLKEFIQRGISTGRAAALIGEASPDQPILDQLEWGDHLLQKSPQSFRNPPGFYIYLVKENVSPPDSFDTSRKRALREEASRVHAEREQNRLRFQFGYDDYRRKTIDRYIAEFMSQGQFEDLVKAKAADGRQRYRTLFRNLPAQTIAELADRDARAEIAERIPLATFEEFCKHTKLSDLPDLGELAERARRS